MNKGYPLEKVIHISSPSPLLLLYLLFVQRVGVRLGLRLRGVFGRRERRSHVGKQAGRKEGRKDAIIRRKQGRQTGSREGREEGTKRRSLSVRRLELSWQRKVFPAIESYNTPNHTQAPVYPTSNAARIASEACHGVLVCRQEVERPDGY